MMSLKSYQGMKRTYDNNITVPASLTNTGQNTDVLQGISIVYELT